jgi:hypothetical protein
MVRAHFQMRYRFGPGRKARQPRERGNDAEETCAVSTASLALRRSNPTEFKYGRERETVSAAPYCSRAAG